MMWLLVVEFYLPSLEWLSALSSLIQTGSVQFCFRKNQPSQTLDLCSYAGIFQYTVFPLSLAQICVLYSSYLTFPDSIN